MTSGEEQLYDMGSQKRGWNKQRSRSIIIHVYIHIYMYIFVYNHYSIKKSSSILMCW